ncbi:MAG TPA: hypothetical protein VFZ58_01710 [Candidatus Saccharimonadales bacterium]
MRTSAARIAAVVLLLATLIMAIPAQAQTKGCLKGIGKKNPILLVPGFNSTTDGWDKDGSLGARVKKLEDTVVNIFNYDKYRTRWITDDNIGPKLAKRVACIAQSSREEGGKGKVIVIGHSMGGLAAQYAANQTVNGRRVADDIGLAIPIGSPFAGSQLADWAITLARSYCAVQRITLVGGKTISADPNKCEAIIDTYTAIGGLRQNSAKLRELPPFPADVPVHAIAGNVQEVKFNIFGVELKPLNSDLVVTTDSATKAKGSTNPAYGGGQSVVECISVWPVPVFSDASCEHTRLLTDKNVQTRVVDAISQYLRQAKFNESGAKFVGDWYVHGAVVTFNEDGTGQESINWGFCDQENQCRVIVEFTWVPTGKGLTYTIRSTEAVAFTEHGNMPVDVDISILDQPGTTREVKFEKPGLLVRSQYELGNAYLCRYELLEEAEQTLCGA